MLAGGTLLACSDLVGGGPEHLTLSLVLLAAVMGFPRTRQPAAKPILLAAPLVFLPALFVAFADPLRHGLIKAIVPLGAPPVGLSWIEALFFGAGLFPLCSTLRVALRAPGRFGGFAAAIGVLAALTTTPVFALATAGFLALIADQVPHPHRGWSGTSKHSSVSRGVIILLATSGITAGWTALRGVLDPTPGGALVCTAAAILGATLGRRLAPRSRTGSICWMLAILTILIAGLGAGSALTDRVGSAAAAWEWGLDGRIWLGLPLAITGLLGGLAAAASPSADRITFWSIAAGLFLGPWALAAGTSAAILGTIGGLIALSLVRIHIRIAGAAIAGACLTLSTADMLPTPERMGDGLYDKMRSKTQWSDHLKARDPSPRRGWLPESTIALATASPDPRSADARRAVAAEIDGLDLEVPSAAASAEEFAGHIAALLAPPSGRMVLLGDTTGEVIRGLSAHSDSSVDVAVSLPGMVRLLADADEIRRETWLDPHIHLQAATAQQRLASIDQASSIIELSRAPWTHGGGASPSRRHLKAVRQRLSDDGIYVLCSHLDWWPDGAPAALAAQLKEVFEHVQIWLPPTGADSLIWVASDTPPALARLSTRFNKATSALERLGYASAPGLAGTAIAGDHDVFTWGEKGTTLPYPYLLNENLFQRPVFHAAGLAAGTDTATSIWDTTDASGLVAEVDEMIRARRMFLSLIDDAQRGEIGAAFETARTLVRDHGDIGARTLEPLIAPHIADAEAALKKAAAQGVTSAAWDDARRFATTARMIAPQSPKPYVMLAEIALGQGDVAKAESHFRTALGHDPKHLRALDGLARTGRLKGDNAQVEQALRASTRHGPRDGTTWHNLGIFMLEQGRHDDAISALESAAALASKEQPQMLAAVMVGMAKVYLAKDEPSGALVRAERATRLNEKSGVAWYLRGRAHYELERYDEAESDFRRAVLTDGSLVEARGAIGQVRAIRGDYAAAAEQFRSVLQLDPNNVPARENLRRLGPLLPDVGPQKP